VACFEMASLPQAGEGPESPISFRREVIFLFAAPLPSVWLIGFDWPALTTRFWDARGVELPGWTMFGRAAAYRS